MSNYSWSRSSRSGNGKWAAFTVIMIIIAVLMTVWRPIDKVSGNRTIEGTVTEKTVKRDGSEDKYIVFIQEIPGGGVASLEVTDSLLRGRFNSSDVYAGIEVGKTYRFEVAGSRVPMWSWYPNIYEYTEITTTD